VHRNISVIKSQNLRKRFELQALTRSNVRFAQKNWLFSRGQLVELKRLTEELRLSIVSGELSNIGEKHLTGQDTAPRLIHDAPDLQH
jgi:hypothetical protein